MNEKKKGINLFDVFLILLALLAGLSVYFTFFNPIQFSRLIHREDKMSYAEVEIILPDDLYWMKDVLKPGVERKDVYGTLDWKVKAVEETVFAGRPWVKLVIDILTAEKDSGVVKYGKYTLAKGSKIFLINNDFMIEGRVLGYSLKKERVAY